VQYSTSDATEYLNSAGDNGWEIVSLGHLGKLDVMCFKRPSDSAKKVAR